MSLYPIVVIFATIESRRFDIVRDLGLLVCGLGLIARVASHLSYDHCGRSHVLRICRAIENKGLL